MADKNPNFDDFKKALIENGAEFSDSFMTNLLRIIQHMKPANTLSNTKEVEDHKNPLASKFPGLAIPNEKPPIFSSDEDSDDEKNKKKTTRLTSKDVFKEEAKPSNDVVVDQAMAELEALAPSMSTTKTEANKEISKKEDTVKESKDRGRKRDSSRDRRHRRSRSRDKRSRSRDRRSRSRDRRKRSRSRHRHRSRSKDRHRSRSRDRHRSRSRDRRRRSRSKERRSRSRGRRSHSRGREDKFGDYSKKPRRRSPEVEMSDDPEPGKVSEIDFIHLSIFHMSVLAIHSLHFDHKFSTSHYLLTSFVDRI